MRKRINNKIIRSFAPCYDPASVGIPEGETLSIKNWILKYQKTIKNPEDILWLLCRPEFISDKNSRLFAVWCAREALKLDSNPDPRSIAACDISEKFANGEATKEELDAAWDAASAAAWDAQIKQLLTYF